MIHGEILPLSIHEIPVVKGCRLRIWWMLRHYPGTAMINHVDNWTISKAGIAMDSDSRYNQLPIFQFGDTYTYYLV